MRDHGFIVVRRLLLVTSIFPLLLTVPFLIWPQLAAEFGSLSSAQSMVGTLKDAHRQSASNRRTAQTVWIPGGEFSMGSDDPQFLDAHPWHRVEARPEFRSASSEEDRTCARTSIAIATASARVVEAQPTLAQTTWVFAA